MEGFGAQRKGQAASVVHEEAAGDPGLDFPPLLGDVGGGLRVKLLAEHT